MRRREMPISSASCAWVKPAALRSRVRRAAKPSCWSGAYLGMSRLSIDVGFGIYTRFSCMRLVRSSCRAYDVRRSYNLLSRSSTTKKLAADLDSTSGETRDGQDPGRGDRAVEGDGVGRAARGSPRRGTQKARGRRSDRAMPVPRRQDAVARDHAGEESLALPRCL